MNNWICIFVYWNGFSKWGCVWSRYGVFDSFWKRCQLIYWHAQHLELNVFFIDTWELKWIWIELGLSQFLAILTIKQKSITEFFSQIFIFLITTLSILLSYKLVQFVFEIIEFLFYIFDNVWGIDWSKCDTISDGLKNVTITIFLIVVYKIFYFISLNMNTIFWYILIWKNMRRVWNVKFLFVKILTIF